MRAVELRPGTSSVIHVFTGAGGSAEEFRDFAMELCGDVRVMALVPAEGAAAAGSVEAMAEAATALVRAAQPMGPYTLVGYSFGGLIALESSRLLQETGEAIAFVGLVDSFFDMRFWPPRLFLTATVRRTVVHVSAMLSQPPQQSARDLPIRFARLVARLKRRSTEPPSPSPGASVQAANLDVMSRWSPRVFTGPVTLFCAAEADFGCDLARLWRPWIPGLTIRRMPGNHIDLVQTPGGPGRLAREVTAATQTAEPLKILVASTFRWPGAARLAAEFRNVGARVEAVGPRGCLVDSIAAVERVHRLRSLRPVSSLRGAIEASGADVIVPYDDRTRHALGILYARSDPATASGSAVRQLLERSLGSPLHFDLVYSRTTLIEIAAECGVLCPATSVVRSSQDVSTWVQHHGFPAVMKTDGSWGGRGVAIVRSQSEVSRSWRTMSRRPSLARAVKRLVVERDPWPLRERWARRRPVVSIQSFVEGRPANVAAACRAGTALGLVQAEVIESDGATGPSTVVRIVNNADMTLAAKSVVGRLQLSGLCGLDFVIDPEGRAHLLELNPRATPTAHLVGADGADPLTSLRASFGQEFPLARSSPYGDGVVALYPQEQERDLQSTHLRSAYHDVPHHAPDLVALLSKSRARRHLPLHGARNRVDQPWSQ